MEGGEIMKKIIATALVILTLASSTAISASAQTGFFLAQNSYTYNKNTYCTCTLSKPGKKDASVKVNLTCTGPLTIRMTDNKGRYIWGEDNTIKRNMMNHGVRTYKLGKNHSVYRLYFKSKGTGFCSVSNPKNCSIK